MHIVELCLSRFMRLLVRFNYQCINISWQHTHPWACSFLCGSEKWGAGVFPSHTTYAVGLVCYTTLTVALDSGLAAEASNEDSDENEVGGFA
jgi:hypothetical protein